MQDFYNNMPYYGYSNRLFAVLIKDEVYVAVHDQYSNLFYGGFNEQCHDLQSQGFVLWRSINAANSAAAIEQARRLDELEINKLAMENARLEQEVQRLEKLIRNNHSIGDTDPYLVLGFKSGIEPTTEEIKEKRKKFSLVLHPDKGGSDFLMQIINSAFDRLKK
ncbi:Uncharacterised protein [Klebsiella grimontii]|uniref:J domain-containing protein n=1 Tax=Klebsiella grimontii TaxID=2058152 RepID=A0A7H4P5W3_9ENTR|nr:Uncharacterised protein [Klebsiella grimontii]HBC9240716.1 J domain-containing protein [Klebsiella oxytoca]HEC2026938.1 J domain-containing protein [Klebsiella oxytoca]